MNTIRGALSTLVLPSPEIPMNFDLIVGTIIMSGWFIACHFISSDTKQWWKGIKHFMSSCLPDDAITRASKEISQCGRKMAEQRENWSVKPFLLSGTVKNQLQRKASYICALMLHICAARTNARVCRTLCPCLHALYPLPMAYMPCELVNCNSSAGFNDINGQTAMAWKGLYQGPKYWWL